MTEWQDEPSVWRAEDPVAPSVVGADSEPALAAADENPVGEVVLLPTRRFSPGDPIAEFVLWRLHDDSLALPVFTTLDRLVAECGQDQPWVRVRLDGPNGSADLAHACGAASVLWDGKAAAGQPSTNSREDEQH
jgi:hypothetical protein